MPSEHNTATITLTDVGTRVHSIHKVSMNTVFEYMVDGKAIADEHTGCKDLQVLHPYARDYIQNHYTAQSYSEFFYKVATGPHQRHLDQEDFSCIRLFTDNMQRWLVAAKATTVDDAQRIANTAAGLFIHGIALGIPIRVVWKEDGVRTAYMCKLSAAVYKSTDRYGWTVTSTAFDESYPFDLIEDEWTIPCHIFSL